MMTTEAGSIQETGGNIANGKGVQLKRLLSRFEDVFKEPSGLPLTQAFDHAIPLIIGHKAANIRPYWHIFFSDK